jgi:hypothetical protein
MPCPTHLPCFHHCISALHIIWQTVRIMNFFSIHGSPSSSFLLSWAVFILSQPLQTIVFIECQTNLTPTQNNGLQILLQLTNSTGQTTSSEANSCQYKYCTSRNIHAKIPLTFMQDVPALLILWKFSFRSSLKNGYSVVLCLIIIIIIIIIIIM